MFGVWVGEDKFVVLSYFIGINLVLKIFKGIMDKVVSKKGVSLEFLRFVGIVERYICKEFGKFVISFCR